MSKMKSKEVLKEVRRSRDPAEFGVRLRVGDIIRMGNTEHFVWFLNDSRAAVIPLRNTTYTFKTLETDVTFQADPASVNISPNSEVPILKRLGREGLIAFLAQRTEERKAVMAKNKEEKNGKSEKEEGPKLGGLGGFLGHPVTGVIRAMGVAGWSFKEVRYVFDKAKIQVADNTIRIQLHKGKSKAQEPADVSKKELAQLRPDPALFAKEEKADKKGKGAKDAKAAGKSKPAKAEADDDGDDDEGDEPAPAKKPKVKPAAKPAKEEAEPADEKEEDDEAVEV